MEDGWTIELTDRWMGGVYEWLDEWIV